MFRILLIDDEPMIKIGVRKLLEDTDYIIAGTANNGMEALEYLKTNSVDIIMTDLKMPVMNGLELIHQLNALSFDGAILVLSNYSDFELVREALTAGALDYILKTDMTRSRLLKYLDKISQSLCLQRKKQVEAAEQALQQEQNSQKLLFAEMERALLTDGALSADVQNFLTNSRGSEARHGMMLIDLSGAQAQHQKPLLRQFQSILPEILSGAGTIQTIQPQQDQLLCLFFHLAGPDILPNRSRQLLRQAEIYFKAQPAIAIGVCSGNGGISSLRTCFEKCQNALRYAFYLPDTHLFPIEKFSPLQEENPSLYHDFLKKTVAACQSRLWDAALTEIRGFLSVCAQNRYDPDWVRSCCCSCMEHLLLSLHISLGDTAAVLMKQLKSALHIDTLQSTLIDGLSEFVLPDSSRNVSSKKEVSSALAYIDGHYMEKITLEELAEHVHLNKSYLCRLFKNETGLSIFHYINEVRMKKAARILADKSASHSVSAVASAVGIDDAFYFTRRFKEYFGKTPREYMQETAADTQ